MIFNDQVTAKETQALLELAEQCLSLEGDFVELGCYRGDTSVLLGKLLASHEATCGKAVENLCKTRPELGKTPTKMCKNSNPTVENRCKTQFYAYESSANSAKKHTQAQYNPASKHLWLYDSFAGLPEKTREDNSGAGQNFRAGELLVTKREVVEKLRRAQLHNVIIKKAWFDELNDQDLPPQIAFAFLDGDLYGSIKTSLKLVVPRLHPQGIIVVHDYNNPELPGASRAVDEFLRGHRDYQLAVRHTLAVLRSKC